MKCTRLLPGGAQHLGDGGLQPFMGIGDDQLHAAQAAPGQLAQKGGPECFGFERADIQPQHLAPAIGIDADHHDHRHRGDTAGVTHLHSGDRGRPSPARREFRL
jgi:hypothetical protein